MVGRGFIYYDWDCDSGDAAGNHVPADVIYQNTMGAIHKGCNIVLMHNTFGKETTIEALKRILPEAHSRGIRIPGIGWYVRSYPLLHLYFGTVY